MLVPLFHLHTFHSEVEDQCRHVRKTITSCNETAKIEKFPVHWTIFRTMTRITVILLMFIEVGIIHLFIWFHLKHVGSSENKQYFLITVDERCAIKKCDKRCVTKVSSASLLQRTLVYAAILL